MIELASISTNLKIVSNYAEKISTFVRTGPNGTVFCFRQKDNGCGHLDSIYLPTFLSIGTLSIGTKFEPIH